MFLSKRNNVVNLLSGKIESNRKLLFEEGETLERKANQISLSISQANEYFRAAESLTLATKPLLYFYGMLSLSKSLIVANSKETYLENINYHGLTQRPRNEELKEYHDKPNSWAMEKEYAVVAPGVFNELSKVISNFEFPDNSIIFLKDILAVCPEIARLYEMYYKEQSNTLSLYNYEEKSKQPFVAEIDFNETEEKKIFASIPEIQRDFEALPALRHGVARTFKSKDCLKAFPDYMGIYYPPVGGRYVIRGLKFKQDTVFSARYVDPVVVDYVAMYILSMCVRYKQELWGEVIEGEKSGIASLIELYTSVSKRRFPNAILNHLFGCSFQYGSPAHLA